MAEKRPSGMADRRRQEVAEIGGQAFRGVRAMPRTKIAAHRSLPLRPGAPQAKAADNLTLERRQFRQPPYRRAAGVAELLGHLVRISLP